jgi:threonine/homoserine/homoserine lactone efflux protein
MTYSHVTRDLIVPVTVIILGMLLAILWVLGSAAFAMLGRRRDPHRTARALTWRVGLSVALFLLLLAGFASGLLKPHTVEPPSPVTHGK